MRKIIFLTISLALLLLVACTGESITSNNSMHSEDSQSEIITDEKVDEKR